MNDEDSTHDSCTLLHFFGHSLTQSVYSIPSVHCCTVVVGATGPVVVVEPDSVVAGSSVPVVGGTNGVRVLTSTPAVVVVASSVVVVPGSDGVVVVGSVSLVVVSAGEPGVVVSSLPAVVVVPAGTVGIAVVDPGMAVVVVITPGRTVVSSPPEQLEDGSHCKAPPKHVHSMHPNGTDCPLGNTTPLTLHGHSVRTIH